MILLVVCSPLFPIEIASDTKPGDTVVYEQQSIHDTKQIELQSAMDDIEHITDEQRI